MCPCLLGLVSTFKIVNLYAKFIHAIYICIFLVSNKFLKSVYDCSYFRMMVLSM